MTTFQKHFSIICNFDLCVRKLFSNRTDFIIAVVGEELGLVGVVFLLLMYLCIIARGLVLAVSAQSTFARLFAGALTLTFFI